MDDADIAAQDSELLLAAWIAAVRRRPAGLQASGSCHFCEEPAAGVFCSPECREDHELEQAAIRRRGRVDE